MLNIYISPPKTSSISRDPMACRLYMAPKIFRHATPWTPWTTSWHGPVLGFAAVLAVAVAVGATALALRSWRARSGTVGLMDGL